MAVNPNYVPWMTILGLVGAGIGYLVAGAGSGPEATLPALYGLSFGCLVGIVVRIVLRRRTLRRAAEDPNHKDQPTSTP